MAMSNIWHDLLGRIETKVGKHGFYTWFKPTTYLSDSPDGVVVLVPNQLFKDWLIKHYSHAIGEAMVEIGRSGLPVVFVTEPPVPAAIDDTPLPQGSEDGDLASDTGDLEPAEEPGGGPDGLPAAPAQAVAGLSPRYTFDTFVVGASNNFAHAACRAVAEAPSRSYNPLFIYGGVGLGKTHLMHAVAHYALRQNPATRLTYISAERFMNEMINALRYERILDFRERYRSLDLLLVDDIQFIAGKEGTQAEFFHTFNALHDAAKQIVISSDCPPHEIPQLEERLRSRFEWGLIADIQPPDLETKVAILKKKAEAEGVPLPDPVALFIATKIKSNIRELEGSLIRLVAYASLKGEEITLALAQHVLKGIINTDERAVTIEGVQKFVADYYQLKPAELRSRNNSKSVAMPRQVAMYLCKTLTNSSLPEIGRSFGGKHHTTVLHSIRKVEELRKRDATFNSLINSFLDNFR
ncbi:MAG: chromosomal replication initiator protein DnaA [Vicinamibacteraceae bacterium]|nr:chromosomal replication initiator protein DnaA [Vicinamibacteraceae bacterium]